MGVVSPHYLKRHYFLKKVIDINCVIRFFLQLLSGTFLIPRRIKRAMIRNVVWSSCKILLLLSDFNEAWIFSTAFRKVLKYKISRKSFQWESSCSMRTDGRTDGRTDKTKQTVAFPNFANAGWLNDDGLLNIFTGLFKINLSFHLFLWCSEIMSNKRKDY
jgi:hypothetical protein